MNDEELGIMHAVSSAIIIGAGMAGFALLLVSIFMGIATVLAK